jgi:hypothetical protein
MTTEEAKDILRQLIEFMDCNFGEQSADVTEGLQDVITLIDKQQDEIESLWMLADEMSKSDISLHEKKIFEELDKIFKEKRKIAKVSEA